MRRSPVVLAIVLGMLALAGSGCPIWIDEHHGSGGPPVCIGSFCDCTWHSDCDPGYACIEGTCEPTGNCYYTPCSPGYVCDTFGTCVPEETVTCDEDADCELGYCDIASGAASGTCVHTGVCAVDGDCVGYGDSFVCDERGVCTPDRGPCPDGSCGCANDTECTGGWLCEAAHCVDPALLCVYDHQCPTGAACVNSFCRVDCSAGASCPSGQVCDGGACMDDADGGGLCTYSSECAGGLCVNGYCILACAESTECGDFESCQSSMCLPEVNRVADCTAADCSGGLSCVDGVCRMPCAAEVNCAGSDPFLHCWEGFCRTENEIANQCDRQLDCLTDLSCVDGACL